MLDGSKELPIRLKRGEEASSDISQASLLSISGKNGIEYIENFSDIKLSRKLGAFSRYKGERENGVKAWTWPRSLPSVSEEYLREDILNFKVNLPSGYRLEQAGEAAESAESNCTIICISNCFFYFNSCWASFRIEFFQADTFNILGCRIMYWFSNTRPSGRNAEFWFYRSCRRYWFSWAGNK